MQRASVLSFQLTTGHMSPPSRQSWTQEVYIVVWSKILQGAWCNGMVVCLQIY